MVVGKQFEKIASLQQQLCDMEYTSDFHIKQIWHEKLSMLQVRMILQEGVS
jgi:hypothetical protein